MTRRLLLTYLSLTVVVLASLEVPLGVANARSERRDLAAKVERDAVAAGALAEDVVESNDPAGVASLRALASRYLASTGGRLVIVDRRGGAIVDADPPAPGPRNFASRPEFRAALGGAVASGIRHSSTLGADLLYVAVPISSGGVVHGAVRVSYPTSTLDDRVRRYWLALLAAAAVVLLLAALLAVSFARWINRPLARLEEAAEAAGAGDLTARAVVPAAPPELRRLTVVFNEMVAKVEALIRSQQDFVADASHQLRTPLTALRLRLENLDGSIDAAGRPGLEAALVEVERLGGLVEALLALARADAGGEAAAELDVAGVARERVEHWRPLAEQRGLTLREELAAVPAARATAARVVQVLDNLIENALGAAPAGTTVTVSVGSAGADVELRVRDSGRGLRPDERERAFDRFWRGHGGGPGSGLGLAIARRLVEGDGGTIELAEAPGGGLEAIVRLPRA